jgi:uncharacterized membrane protein (DUF441 family)
MNTLREVFDELLSMFAGDIWLTAGALVAIAAAAAVRYLTDEPSIAVGAILFAGCALALTLRVIAAAQRPK